MHIYNSGLSVGATDAQMLERDELSDAVLFLLRGGPILYYGDEKGMTGSGGDQAARQDMFATQVADWQGEYRIGGAPIGSQSAFDVHNPMEGVITSLQQLYVTYPALKSGTQQVRVGQGNIFAVSRYGDNREFLVAFNDGDDSQTFTSPVSTTNSSWTPISGTANNITATGNSVTLTLPPRSWTVLKAESNFVPQQSTLSVTLNEPKIDYNTQNWVELSASVPGNDFETVTFNFKIPGGSWQSAGSTDHRTYAYADTPGGLFRTYLHPHQFKNGTRVQIVAVVKDALGNLASSALKTYTINY
jgi:hypothetical protein